MAHAYKKTLLAQLGFADADKQNPRHDLAVEYLALPHNSKRVIQGLHDDVTWELASTAKQAIGHPDEPPHAYSWETRQLSGLKTPERECPLTKGEGQYRATVGFLDLLLRYELIELVCSQDTKPGARVSQRALHIGQSTQRAVVIEVKAQPLPTGDLLRQMKLYREYAETLRVADVRWVVAGCFKFSETQAEALRQERITPISLGALFDEWAERQRTDRTTAKNVDEF